MGILSIEELPLNRDKADPECDVCGGLGYLDLGFDSGFQDCICVITRKAESQEHEQD
jgi:hypothetical protein